MLNEFVYCPRLFYYEFVEGVFVESADTLRGDAVHQRVDSGDGALPSAARHSAAESSASDPSESQTPESKGGHSSTATERAESIHSRSVQMGSARLGVVAKMDLIEVQVQSTDDAGTASSTGDLFAALEVCPVDYKAGAPREGAEANELWDTDKMQVGLQALILRDNGYICNEGIVYYRATKQRVRLLITAELENWILERLNDARRTIGGPIPPPLDRSPKCVRCSLAPVCLPDETRHASLDSESQIANLKSNPPRRPRRHARALPEHARFQSRNQRRSSPDQGQGQNRR